jgi:Protein of unknown function (DUF3300)
MLRVIGRYVFALSLLMPVAAAAQAPSSPAPASTDQLLKPEQLDALVAPIALYPDTLLANVLIASTYPLEVVQADRWVSENKNLKGDQLKTAAEKQAWDDNVKGLVATPSVLSMMSTKLDWTQQLGDAVLAQQPDVMDAIQRLRARAQTNNKLQSTKQQKVTVTQEGARQVIAIASADPSTVYVPYYDPGVVFGSWPYPAYPPYYWGYPGYIAAGVIATGLAFGAGYALGRWASGGGCCWGGGSVNWNRNNINIGSGNRATQWQHNPAHRQGVRYNNVNVQQRFGNNNIRNGAQNRTDFRGRGGQQVLNPGGDRGGNRPGGGAAGRPGGDRPGAGNRPAQRPSAGNRPSQRPSASTRPSGGGGARRDTAFGNMQSGRAANFQSARGQASLGGGGARFSGGGGGGFRGGGGGGGGGGFRGGGGGGGGRGGGGGGRRSDIALKHDVVLLGRLDNGLGFYRFTYNGGHRAYVGVIAQEVEAVVPEAVVRGRDGYLRVFYDRLGLTFETYDAWLADGAHLPAAARFH